MVEPSRIEPSQADVDAARRLRRAVQSPGAAPGGGAPLRLAGVELPPAAHRALDRILEEFEEGNAVVVEGVREEVEYTTTQAAAELGMSRPTLIRLLDAEEMRYRMVGTHRRVPRSEVERYRRAMERGGEGDAPSVREPDRAVRSVFYLRWRLRR
jgi:excisionase family DNA binding protein